MPGLIERAKGSQRYVVTDGGYKIALWLNRCQARILRPSLGEALDAFADTPLQEAIAKFDKFVEASFQAANVKTAA